MMNEDNILDSTPFTLRQLLIAAVLLCVIFISIFLVLIFKLSVLNNNINALKQNASLLMSEVDSEIQSEHEFICFPIESGVEKEMTDTSFVAPAEM